MLKTPYGMGRCSNAMMLSVVLSRISTPLQSFFFQAEDGIRDDLVTGVQTSALPILSMLTVALPLRGARVHTLICDRALPACSRAEERSVGKECRSRVSPYH